MHTAACKEFYANLIVSLSRKKEVATSMVRVVKIELDSMILTSIQGVPGNTGICEYIKEVWQESKYIKPLEIIRKFVNDKTITAARRNEEVAEEEQNQEFDWEAVIDKVELQEEEVNEEAKLQGENKEKETEVEESG
ncbi:hypothetical protein Dimus_000918 [Dionaea muscipula]